MFLYYCLNRWPPGLTSLPEKYLHIKSICIAQRNNKREKKHTHTVEKKDLFSRGKNSKSKTLIHEIIPALVRA